jgi:hypothetical protein
MILGVVQRGSALPNCKCSLPCSRGGARRLRFQGGQISRVPICQSISGNQRPVISSTKPPPKTSTAPIGTPLQTQSFTIPCNSNHQFCCHYSISETQDKQSVDHHHHHAGLPELRDESGIGNGSMRLEGLLPPMSYSLR